MRRYTLVLQCFLTRKLAYFFCIGLIVCIRVERVEISDSLDFLFFMYRRDSL